MIDILDHLHQTVAHIRQYTQMKPVYGIILGTGLGQLVDEMEIETTLDYRDLPHYPIATAESHAGKLHFGRLAGQQVVVAQGRFHYYEGYTMQQVTYPVRVMKLLGMQKLLMSNISGGLNPGYDLSDLIGIEDHINLHFENPLAGPNLNTLGPRWPNMNEPYDLRMLDQAEAFCDEEGYRFKRGVYVSLPGPNLETPAEYRYLRLIGADCVGMSTVPEVIVARHMAVPTFVLSIITDLAYGEIKPVGIEQLLAVAAKAQPRMTAIFKHLVQGVTD